MSNTMALSVISGRSAERFSDRFKIRVGIVSGKHGIMFPQQTNVAPVVIILSIIMKFKLYLFY